MPRLHPVPPRRPDAAGDPQSGVALVMALIFSILLYILVADLVVSSRMVRATGENDALLARMNTLMLYELGEAEQKLLADIASAAAEGEGGGELGAALAGAGAGGEGGLPEGEEAEEDPAAICDSSASFWRPSARRWSRASAMRSRSSAEHDAVLEGGDHHQLPSRPFLRAAAWAGTPSPCGHWAVKSLL